MDCSLPGSSLHGIFQARILEWVVTSSSRGCPDPRIEPASPALGGGFFKHGATLVSFHSFVWDGLLEAVLCSPEAFDSSLENHHPSLPWGVGKKWLGLYLFFFPQIILLFVNFLFLCECRGFSYLYLFIPFPFLAYHLRHRLLSTVRGGCATKPRSSNSRASYLYRLLTKAYAAFDFSIFKKEVPTRYVNFWFASSESTPEYGSPKGLWHLSITGLISKWFAGTMKRHLSKLT